MYDLGQMNLLHEIGKKLRKTYQKSTFTLPFQLNIIFIWRFKVGRSLIKKKCGNLFYHLIKKLTTNSFSFVEFIKENERTRGEMEKAIKNRYAK